jgi:hypothetical protein
MAGKAGGRRAMTDSLWNWTLAAIATWFAIGLTL